MVGLDLNYFSKIHPRPNDKSCIHPMAFSQDIFKISIIEMSLKLLI